MNVRQMLTTNREPLDRPMLVAQATPQRAAAVQSAATRQSVSLPSFAQFVAGVGADQPAATEQSAVRLPSISNIFLTLPAKQRSGEPSPVTSGAAQYGPIPSLDELISVRKQSAPPPHPLRREARPDFGYGY